MEFLRRFEQKKKKTDIVPSMKREGLHDYTLPHRLSTTFAHYGMLNIAKLKWIFVRFLFYYLLLPKFGT